jgi:hypothetical protein
MQDANKSVRSTLETDPFIGLNPDSASRNGTHACCRVM